MIIGHAIDQVLDPEDAQDREIEVAGEIAIDPAQDPEIESAPYVIAPGRKNQEKSAKDQEVERKKGTDAVKAKIKIEKRKLKGNLSIAQYQNYP